MTKYKSETIRKGEPSDHEYAVLLVEMWLSDNYVQPSSLGMVARTYSGNREFVYPKEFRTHKDYPKVHRPDITLYGWLDKDEEEHIFGFIEIDGKHGGTYKGLDGKRHKFTPTKHDHPKQKINDHIFEDYSRKYHNVAVLRLLKEEILTDDKVDRETYLNKRLSGLKRIKIED